MPVDEIGDRHCYKTTAEYEEKDHPLISTSLTLSEPSQVESLTILEYLWEKDNLGGEWATGSSTFSLSYLSGVIVLFLVMI